MPRIAAIALLFVSGFALAEDWPHWRGPNRDGISSEKGFRVRWGETAPPKVWHRDIGPAFSAFAIVGGKAYTCGTANAKQVLFCLDAETGNVVWQMPIEEEYPDEHGSGTRATPTVSDGRVYIQGARGRVVCFDAADGREVWSRSFDTKPQWGYSGSVLIQDNLAIVHGNNALTALEKDTGKVVWTCAAELVGYSTPYPFTLDGRRYVAGFMGKELLIVEQSTGHEALRKEWETSWNVNAATPIFDRGYLFVSSGYRHGSSLLKLARLDDKLRADPVWENQNILAKFQTPVLYEGHLYTSDQKELKCVEFLSGDIKWKKPRTAHGTVVIADGHLIVLTEEGRLLIAEATPTGFAPKTDVPLGDGRHWTVPTLYNKRLYVRDLEGAACFDLSEK